MYQTTPHSQGSTTSPIRLRAIRRSLVAYQKHQQSIYSDIPTQLIGATGPMRKLPGKNVVLPHDEQGRPFLASHNFMKPTHKLVPELTDQYHRLTGYYPHEVVLSALRYLAIPAHLRYYYPPHSGIRITFVCEPFKFDVVARGIARGEK